MDLLASEMYESISARSRRLSRIFVLRAHADEARALTITGSKVVAALTSRFVGASIYVMHLEGTERVLTHVAGSPSIDAANEDELVSAMRSAELETLALEPSALLPESNTFHYVGPSGRHYRSFLRVGTALQSSSALDSVCFWLVGHLSPSTVIVLDSPTLMSVGLAMSQYVRDQNLSTHVTVIAVDVLDDSSEDASLALAKRLARIQSSNGSKVSVLCVGSVLSSGKTLSLIQAAADLVEIAHSSAVIFGVPGRIDGHDEPVLARAPARLASVEPCEICVEQGPQTLLIRIDPTSLHLDVGGAVSRQKITRKSASRGSIFLETYAGSGAISAHYTERGGHGRHHAINVDVAELLKNETFRRRFLDRVETLRGQVDCIISPEHSAARELAQLAGSVLGIEAISCDEDRLTTLSSQHQASIKASRSLLMVDDVVISGDRMRGYRQFLFALGRPRGDVHILVGLSRPSTDSEAMTIRNLADQITTKEQSFHAIEEVLLPNWGEDECPWCIESQQIDDYPGKGDDLAFSNELLNRSRHLQYPYDGITAGLFWSADGTAMELGAGSIFAPERATEAELFFGVASAIQQMRSDDLLDEDYRPPASKILTHEFWARGRFYAPAITASILRACRSHDLMPSQPSKKLVSSIEVRLAEQAGHAVAWELLYAIAMKKLPRVTIPSNLQTDSRDDVIFDFLTTLVESSEGSQR